MKRPAPFPLALMKALACNFLIYNSLTLPNLALRMYKENIKIRPRSALGGLITLPDFQPVTLALGPSWRKSKMEVEVSRQAGHFTMTQ